MDHILGASEHEELRGHEASIQKTIEAPISIYQSAAHLKREVYYRPSDLPFPYDRGFIRVIVEFTANPGQPHRGHVITAHHTFRPKSEEVIRWSRTS